MFVGLRIFVRNKCEQGPLLNKSKLANVPAVIGPENPFTVLKKLVEQIVFCADSPKEVCKLLATERDKMPISKIVKVRILVSNGRIPCRHQRSSSSLFKTSESWTSCSLRNLKGYS